MDELKILLDLMANQDNIKESNAFKTLKEFPVLMNDIDKIMEECTNKIPLDLLLSYVAILNKACQDLKPIYLKMLLVKEAHNANK